MNLDYILIRSNFANTLFVKNAVDEFKMEQYAENDFISKIYQSREFREFIVKRDDIKNVYNKTIINNSINTENNLYDIQFRNSEIQKHIMYTW